MNGDVSTIPPVRIGISACLLGERVRFDGNHKRDAFLVEVFGRHVTWVPVCPEVEMGVGPENPNQWKYLTFVPPVITLQPYCFPNLLTICDKGSDHATRRLHPARIDRHMVSLTCIHADRNRCSAPPNRGLQTNDRSAPSANQ
jgi:2-thiouracil desulfurase